MSIKIHFMFKRSFVNKLSFQSTLNTKNDIFLGKHIVCKLDY